MLKRFYFIMIVVFIIVVIGIAIGLANRLKSTLEYRQDKIAEIIKNATSENSSNSL